MANKKIGWTVERALPWLMLIGGLIGLIASLALSIEKFDALKNPHYIPVCNLNPIFSCSTVSGSNQAEAFGFYNPFLGLAGYAGVAAIGLALLAGAKFKRWFWQVVQLGSLFAIGFVTWLQFEALYRIGALCLFCMIAWAVTIPLFIYVTTFNIRSGHLGLPAWLARVSAFVQRFHAEILISWYAIIIILILKRFWYYFGHL